MAYRAGFVYVLSNPAMPGLVKVGYTDLLPENRARKLRSTGVPLHFTVEHRMLTSHPQAVERAAHRILRGVRVSEQREFFATEVPVAVNAVRQAVAEQDGIEGWQTDEPVRLDHGDRIALSLRAGQMFAVLPYRPTSETQPPLDLWQAHGDGDVLELMAEGDPRSVSGFSLMDPDGDEDPVPYLNREEDAVNGWLIGKERLDPGQRLLWLDGQCNKPATLIGWFEFHAFGQVVCRTWNPQLTDEGWPVLLNQFDIEPTPTMAAVLHGSCRLPRPELSESARVQALGSAEYGTRPQTAAHWLTQLQSRGR
ncbi:GIY-YIG nuclease family protein [Actinoplanes sp. TFC3]|uniref:GIY-YIG nuclease family protein n=1 Tax=Actinoplanes sp. TFC3 TaxID=1710355 RepID=UPI00082B7CE2|nr:GIY-YIG nuclease family protein [Actinoplanes sp. TFC3]